jgi:hypothetical protein
MSQFRRDKSLVFANKMVLYSVSHSLKSKCVLDSSIIKLYSVLVLDISSTNEETD